MINEEKNLDIQSAVISDLQRYSVKIGRLENENIDLKRRVDYQSDILQGHSSFINELKEKQQKRKERRELCLTIFLCGLFLLWFIVGIYGIPVLFNQIF